jgi:hypothetical protein
MRPDEAVALFWSQALQSAHSLFGRMKRVRSIIIYVIIRRRSPVDYNTDEYKL